MKKIIVNKRKIYSFSSKFKSLENYQLHTNFIGFLIPKYNIFNLFPSKITPQTYFPKVKQNNIIKQYCPISLSTQYKSTSFPRNFHRRCMRDKG